MLHGLAVVELIDERTADAGRLLSQLGADVIAVEPPAGSPMRSEPPFADDRPGGEQSLRWWAASLGKRSVRIDLGSVEGRARWRRLVATSDIVIESRGTRLDDDELGWAAMSRSNPSLIWVSVTPFGRDSERRERPTTDLTLLAGGGPMWNCGYDDHSIPPMRGAGNQAHRIGGWYAAIGALTALAHRDRTGEGQLVDVSVDAACNVTSEHATYNWLLIGEECRRQTGRHAYYTPTAPVQVRCADGRYATTGVLPRTPSDFAQLHGWLEELGLLPQLPEAVFLQMAADRDGPVDAGSVGTDDEATAILAAARAAINLVAATLPAEEFFLQSQARNLPAAAILSPDEAFESAHLAERGYPIEIDVPQIGRSVRVPGSPFLSSSSPAWQPSAPPLLGEHDPEAFEPVHPPGGRDG